MSTNSNFYEVIEYKDVDSESSDDENIDQLLDLERSKDESFSNVQSDKLLPQVSTAIQKIFDKRMAIFEASDDKS